MKELTYGKAICEAIAYEMRRDQNVLYWVRMFQ